MVRKQKKFMTNEGDTMLESKLLYYLQAIDHYKSLTLAAESLYMTQPALSIAMKNFEKKLDISLIYKANNHIHLTPQAQEILRLGDPAIQALNNIELYINCFSLQKSETIYLVFNEYASYLTTAQIASNIFNQSICQLNLESKIFNSNAEIVDYVQLHPNHIGMIFSADSAPFEHLPNYMQLMSDNIYLKLNAHSRFLGNHSSSITIKEIGQTPLIHIKPGEAIAQFYDALGQYNPPNIYQSVSTVTLMDAYIKADLGAGLVLGFNKSLLLDQDSVYKYLRISDSHLVHLCLFSSPNMSDTFSNKVYELIRLSLQ